MIKFVRRGHHITCTDFKVLKSDQHQVLGRYSGTVISVRDFISFAK